MLIDSLKYAIARMEGYLDAAGNVIGRGRSGVNNNPGNLRDVWLTNQNRWWIWPSLPHDDQGFPRFPTPEAGWAALERDLQLKINKGMSLDQLISAWAPPHENDTAGYLANVAAWTGIPTGVQLRSVNVIGPPGGGASGEDVVFADTQPSRQVTGVILAGVGLLALYVIAD